MTLHRVTRVHLRLIAGVDLVDGTEALTALFFLSGAIGIAIGAWITGIIR